MLNEQKMNMSNDVKVQTLNLSASRRKLQRDQEIDNPCLQEHNLSLKCLSDNNYVHDACEAYFLNYKHCRNFWMQVVTDRRLKNIVPSLPSPQDRTKIKNEYIKSGIIN